MGDTQDYIKELTENYHKQIIKEKYLVVTELDYGIFQFTCWTKKWDMPIGMVWVRFGSNQENETVGDILDCYTTQWARRNGICRFLYTAILERVDILRTANGSDEGGDVRYREEG